jgi:hypothetical protein
MEITLLSATSRYVSPGIKIWASVETIFLVWQLVTSGGILLKTVRCYVSRVHKQINNPRPRLSFEPLLLVIVL